MHKPGTCWASLCDHLHYHHKSGKRASHTPSQAQRPLSMMMMVVGSGSEILVTAACLGPRITLSCASHILSRQDHRPAMLLTGDAVICMIGIGCTAQMLAPEEDKEVQDARGAGAVESVAGEKGIPAQPGAARLRAAQGQRNWDSARAGPIRVLPALQQLPRCQASIPWVSRWCSP